MKEIIEGIYTWSWFSQEKQIPFNGFYVRSEEAAVIVDPPPYGGDDLAEMERLGAPRWRFSSPMFITAAGRQSSPSISAFPSGCMSLMPPGASVKVTSTFKDGDVLEGGLVAVHVPHAKSPGETAFHHQASGALIVGDAIIGKPAGQVRLLPAREISRC